MLNHPDVRTGFFRFEAMLNQFSSPLPLVVLCLCERGRHDPQDTPMASIRADSRSRIG
ncbi:MAG: hypothetical protein WAK82_21920 [Streptosporangiaceae bacterium]